MRKCNLDLCTSAGSRLAHRPAPFGSWSRRLPAGSTPVPCRPLAGAHRGPGRAAPAGAADDILRTLEARAGLGRPCALPEPARRATGPPSPASIRTGAAARREIADSSIGRASVARRSTPARAAPAFRPARQRAPCAAAAPGRSRSRSPTAQGPRRQLLEREIGDFVLLRADGQFAQARGGGGRRGARRDRRGARRRLLDSTPRQIWLQQGSARRRAICVLAAVNDAGEKLSKQTGARRWTWRAKAQSCGARSRSSASPRAMTSREQ